MVYPLPEILRVVLCATLGGAEDFVEIARRGNRKLDFLRRLLPCARGVAWHDTLDDGMNAPPAPLFAECFTAWVESLREAAPDIVAIDGKTSRRRRLPATPPLPARSPPTRPPTATTAASRSAAPSSATTWPGSPRIDASPARGASPTSLWQVERDGRTSLSRRHHIASARLSAPAFAAAVRAHWGIENRVMDVVFHDDLMRLRTAAGPADMATIRHAALTIVKEIPDKASLKVRRKTLGSDDNFLLEALTQPPQ